MKLNCENTKNRREYIPPVLCLMAFALEEGFALSVEKVNKEGRTSSSFKNADRWYNSNEDQGVGNEYFKDAWDTPLQ